MENSYFYPTANLDLHYAMHALTDPGFGQGGAPRNFVRDFADEAKRSRASKASHYWPGSRARLRALEALAFLTV